MNKRSMLLSAILSAAILSSACGIVRIGGEETKDAPENTATAQSTGSQEGSEETGVTTTSESVNIPPETLPEGQLFEDKYYVILQGEGTIFNVFDCYGEIIKTFRADVGGPAGLYEKNELEDIIRYWSNIDASNYEYNPDTGEVRYREDFPGGYYESNSSNEEEACRIVTDKETIRFTKKNADSYSEGSGILRLEDRTLIDIVISHHIYGEVDTIYSYDIFYAEIKNDGTVVTRRFLENLPNVPYQITGADRIIVFKLSETSYIYTTWNLTDLSGNVLMENVVPIMRNQVGSISFYDYFLKDGTAYDANMNPVPDEMRSNDGRLIPGVTYYVEGIPCNILNKENYSGVEFYSWMPIHYATGKDDNDNIAIKADWGDCVIHGSSAEVVDASSSFVLLDDNSIYSFETGEKINVSQIGNFGSDVYYQLSQDYVLITDYSSEEHISQFVIDKTGNLRYTTDKSWISITKGPYLIIYRGPYVGLADLNGDWILKTLKWNIKRDADLSSGE